MGREEGAIGPAMVAGPLPPPPFRNPEPARDRHEPHRRRKSTPPFQIRRPPGEGMDRSHEDEP
jgi:hypothetical protein